jgi:hypothetical protein
MISRMRRLIYLMVILSSPGLLMAQIQYRESFYSISYGTQSIQAEAIEVIDGVATFRYSQHEHKVNGSPYLDPEFQFGVMSTVEAVSIEGLKYRYDIYSDEMQFILREDTASITKPLTLRHIEIGPKKFIYDVYETGENTVAAGYFEVIEEGQLTGLLRREMELEQDIYVQNYGGGGGTKDFYYKENKSFYLKVGKDIARKVTSKKSFLEVIPDHRDEVKAFMKSEKISIKRPEKLKEAIAFYNELSMHDPDSL